MKDERTTPKYGIPEAIDLPDRMWPSQTVTASPVWCSVDLRDGNQALPDPMDPDQKLEYFELLCRIGFKHIEIAFPSASEADFRFTRRLVEEDRIPDDVYIMGLTQCRPHLIDRTFEAFRGLKRGIVHAYIAASELHRQHVFGMDRAKTLEKAVEAARQIRARAEAMPEADIRFQFSPEEFTDTDLEFTLDLCTQVYEAWGKATPEKPLILNLPATVERRPPNHYADMIEWFAKNFPHRESVSISVHSHNDQGMAVAATELTLLAGADRVEGTLFGHGERTGNVDLVTVANNLYARGIETGLDFSDIRGVADVVERLTGMPVYYRQPYAGEYVFTAFSGSHQDAINKGVHRLGEAPDKFGMRWKVPYLHIDPEDLGRKFERLIRINSQSGKGGIAWVLEQDYDIEVPQDLRSELREIVQAYSDRMGREVASSEVYDLFRSEFLEPEGPYELVGYWPRPDREDPGYIHGEVRIKVHGEEKAGEADGNGPVSAFVNAVRPFCSIGFSVDDYHEQAVGKGADATAMAFVPLKLDDGRIVYGAGSDSNIDQAAVRAIVAGLNRLEGS
ncbi:2-isopropylmalate synthase [Kiritimatiella glycovorans]|uniref:2-isopropylmalate synthase n=1 Tax=Kiritimatiella glycovorans TaxID=1307763 RepID=A0A0G3EED3_9BACT|nr:2-isopropylmalate synthase [Kiritimatiella glycovorans]AKJ63782.1 2-isopropylmalate synthase [Kiritimatiella glycovorans]